MFGCDEVPPRHPNQLFFFGGGAMNDVINQLIMMVRASFFWGHSDEMHLKKATFFCGMKWDASRSGRVARALLPPPGHLGPFGDGTSRAGRVAILGMGREGCWGKATRFPGIENWHLLFLGGGIFFSFFWTCLTNSYYKKTQIFLALSWSIVPQFKCIKKCIFFWLEMTLFCYWIM